MRGRQSEGGNRWGLCAGGVEAGVLVLDRARVVGAGVWDGVACQRVVVVEIRLGVGVGVVWGGVALGLGLGL